ncbi:hypothetical protein [Nonomuraea sp. NPDC049784]|uniref:hypothetical protein n=1 Tax=Nonomuraea sp. NPDC049784 TaxID=3154361 RepID=UPI0033CD8B58
MGASPANKDATGLYTLEYEKGATQEQQLFMDPFDDAAELTLMPVRDELRAAVGTEYVPDTTP